MTATTATVATKIAAARRHVGAGRAEVGATFSSILTERLYFGNRINRFFGVGS
jgi:hypothetical protein